MFADHAPLLDIRVFAELQMTRTRSGRLCNFELQIVPLCGSLPLLFHPSWLTVLSIEVGKFRSVTVVVATLWIAVDT